MKSLKQSGNAIIMCIIEVVAGILFLPQLPKNNGMEQAE